MTRYRLSQITEIEQSTLSNLMTHKSLPNIITLSRICDGFGITLSQFFQERDEMPDLSVEQRRVLDTQSALNEMERNSMGTVCVNIKIMEIILEKYEHIVMDYSVQIVLNQLVRKKLLKKICKGKIPKIPAPLPFLFQ